MSTLVLEVPTSERMRALGEALGRVALPGDRFLLEGPFGAGKTTFVQGLALGLGVATPVGSPTFVIETQYRGRLTLYHIDLYRLERIEPELLQSLEEDMFDEGVTAVEWAERLPDELRKGAAILRFSVQAAGRLIDLEAQDDRLIDAASSS